MGIRPLLNELPRPSTQELWDTKVEQTREVIILRVRHTAQDPPIISTEFPALIPGRTDG